MLVLRVLGDVFAVYYGAGFVLGVGARMAGVTGEYE